MEVNRALIKKRNHKGMLFEPARGFKDRDKAYAFAKKKVDMTNHFRVYPQKRGYVVYIGPKKELY